MKSYPPVKKKFALKAQLAFVAGVIATIGGCSQPDNNSSRGDSKPEVVASHTVICDLIETVARDTVDLTCLIDPGQNPHTYDPTPGDRQAIEKAELLIYGGYKIEPKVAQLMEASKSSPKIAMYEKVVPDPIMADSEHDHEVEAVKTEEFVADPHIWHDVENAIAIVNVITTQLTEINPEDASFYNNNAQQLTDKLQKLNAWIEAQIATIPEKQRVLVTTHDALGYFIRAYGLKESQSLQGISSEEAPTASRLKDLVATIEQTGVPTIFAERNANERLIDTVAREAKVKVAQEELIADGLGEKGSETGTYIGMMVNNTCTIVNGLGGNCQPFE